MILLTMSGVSLVRGTPAASVGEFKGLNAHGPARE